MQLYLDVRGCQYSVHISPPEHTQYSADMIKLLLYVSPGGKEPFAAGFYELAYARTCELTRNLNAHDMHEATRDGGVLDIDC